MLSWRRHRLGGFWRAWYCVPLKRKFHWHWLHHKTTPCRNKYAGHTRTQDLWINRVMIWNAVNKALRRETDG